MIRAIFQREVKDQHTGCETRFYETVLLDVPEIEQRLLRGGFSETGYDTTALLGVEVVRDEGVQL